MKTIYLNEKNFIRFKEKIINQHYSPGMYSAFTNFGSKAVCEGMKLAGADEVEYMSPSGLVLVKQR